MARFIVLVLVSIVGVTEARAQSFEVSGHAAVAQWSEFDGNDVGVGGRFTFRPLPLIGLDAELSWYPKGFPPDTVAIFTGSRIEGMFGATAGPKIGRIRPFAKAAAGFLNNRSSAAAFACVAIFPPPLACLLAGGNTMAAYEIGGGVAIDATSTSFVRLDVTDRLLKYPGPTFRGPGLRNVVDDDFIAGALKFTIGAGFRF